jgi:hypothetical protein
VPNETEVAISIPPNSGKRRWLPGARHRSGSARAGVDGRVPVGGGPHENGVGDRLAVGHGALVVLLLDHGLELSREGLLQAVDGRQIFELHGWVVTQLIPAFSLHLTTIPSFPPTQIPDALFTALEKLKRQTARHRGRQVLAEVQNALVEQSVLHELDQVAELLPGKPDRPEEQRIDAGLEDPLNRAFKEIVGDLVDARVIAKQRNSDVEVVRDGGFQCAEGAVVEEGWSHLQVAQRRGAKGIPQRGIALRLLEPEVLILAGTIEDRVAGAKAENRRDLGAADAVRREVAEHLVRRTSDRVALDAPGSAEKKQGAALLTLCHRPCLAAGKPVQRRVCGGEAGLELGDRAPPHADGNAAGRQRHAAVVDLTELLEVGWNRIKPGVHGSLDREIVESRLVGRRQDLPVAVVELEMAAAEGPRIGGDSGEPSHLHQFGRRERPLSRQERRFAEDDVFGGWELESQ